MPRLFDPRTDDVAALAVLHAASFAQAWSASFIRDLLAGPGVFARNPRLTFDEACKIL